MELPFISCKCITYGRVGMLEEALHSFLQQDYPKDKCELVIVNDYPLQKLKFKHPQVRIHNMEFTFSTIGEKETYATDICMGEIICQWDDDDVAMPWHLKNVAEQFTDDVNILHWNTGVFYNEPAITAITWLGNSGIVFRKSAWEAIGGHPLENAGYDMTFIERLHKYGGRKIVQMPKEKASWFYMWGGRGYHMSGQGHDKSGEPNVIERHSKHIESLRKQGKIPTGSVDLKPNWRRDYKKMLEQFLKKP
jgi:glycosyltransferase involved in cell wall biosynthesis